MVQSVTHWFRTLLQTSQVSLFTQNSVQSQNQQKLSSITLRVVTKTVHWYSLTKMTVDTTGGLTRVNWFSKTQNTVYQFHSQLEAGLKCFQNIQLTNSKELSAC